MTNEKLPVMLETIDGGNTRGRIEEILNSINERVKAGEVAKSSLLAANIDDRERLIGLAKGQQELKQSAQEAVDYVSNMKEAGGLTDAVDIEKLNELQEILNLSQEQLADTNNKIALLTESPGVVENLHEEAVLENDKIDENKESERKANESERKANERIENNKLEAKQLLADFSEYMEERESIYGEYRPKGTRLKEARVEFKRHIGTYIKGESQSKILSSLAEKRARLGFFQFREKKQIDHKLSKTSIIQELIEADKSYDDLVIRRTNHDNKQGSYIQRYKGVVRQMTRDEDEKYKKDFLALCGEEGREIARSI